MSGLELRNQPAERGEALPDEFDGKVLNPNGIEIDLPYWVFKRLKKLHMLESDRETGLGRSPARADPQAGTLHTLQLHLVLFRLILLQKMN
jgi:hypothetical protein